MEMEKMHKVKEIDKIIFMEMMRCTYYLRTRTTLTIKTIKWLLHDMGTEQCNRIMYTRSMRSQRNNYIFCMCRPNASSSVVDRQL